MMGRASRTLVVGVVANLCWGCAVADADLECGPGQELRETYCFDIVDAGPESASEDAADGASEAEAAVEQEGGATGEFGRACADDSGCGEPAPFCALKPGDPEGYCTVTGCLDDPSVCPSGYSCMDLTAFGVPDFCALD